jgi:hypothetical protein
MAVTNQELLIAGVLVGLVALVVYNKDPTEVGGDDDPEDPRDPEAAETAREEQVQVKLEKTMDDQQHKIRKEMEVWAGKVDSFLSGLPELPQMGMDDAKWASMGAHFQVGDTLFNRLKGALEHWNTTAGRTSFKERPFDDEVPSAFSDARKRLIHRVEAWSEAYKAQVKHEQQRRIDAPHRLGADVAPPAAQPLAAPANEDSKRAIPDLPDSNKTTPLPGEEKTMGPSEVAMSDFNQASAEPTQNDAAADLSTRVADQDPSTKPAHPPQVPFVASQYTEDAYKLHMDQLAKNQQVVEAQNRVSTNKNPYGAGQPYARPMHPEDAISPMRRAGRQAALEGGGFGAVKKAKPKKFKRPGADEPPAEFNQAPKKRGRADEGEDLSVPPVGGNSQPMETDTAEVPGGVKRAITGFQEKKRIKGQRGQAEEVGSAETPLDLTGKENPLDQTEIVDQNRLMAPPGRSAPKPPTSRAVVLTKEGSRALIKVEEAIMQAKGSLEQAEKKLIEIERARSGQVKRYVWDDDQKDWLKVAYKAAQDMFYLYEKPGSGYPTVNAIYKAKSPQDVLYKAREVWDNGVKETKFLFEKLWNYAFGEIWNSSRKQYGRELKYEWRKDWAERLCGKNARPLFYFEGCNEKPTDKDQILWKLDRIWSSSKTLKKDTGYIFKK